MALKIYDSENQIPEALKGEYKQREDKKWAPDVPDYVPKERLSELRTATEGTLRERNEYKPIVDKLKEMGLTLEQVEELANMREDLKKEKYLKKGEINKIIEDATAQMREKHTKEIDSIKTENAKLDEELSRLRIEEVGVTEAVKFGLQDHAVPDLKARLRAKFKTENGVPVARDEHGQIVLDDEGHPLSVVKEVKNLVSSAPHLWKKSGGGNQPDGGSRGGGRNGEPEHNPWKRGEHFNLTLQGKIKKENPQMADRLKREAGVKVL